MSINERIVSFIHRRSRFGRILSMRGPSLAKSVVWALLLSWPWVVMYVSRNSPEMIAKGFADRTSIWMPVVADVLLIAGGLFAFHSRRRTMTQSGETRAEIFRKGHHMNRRTRETSEK